MVSLAISANSNSQMLVIVGGCDLATGFRIGDLAISRMQDVT